MAAESPDDIARRDALWQTHREKLDKLVQEHPLRYVFFEVTRRCNLACAYCGSGCSPKATRDEVPTSEWVEIVRQIARDFDAKKIMVAVTGGEPLLKEDVEDVFHELHVHGFGFGMVTNGFLIDPERARKIVDTRHRLDLDQHGCSPRSSTISFAAEGHRPGLPRPLTR